MQDAGQKAIAKPTVLHDARPMQPRTEPQDHMLLEAIQSGDHGAFATLVRRHNQRFYALAYRMLSDRAEAEDIVQECFLSLWERPDRWRPDQNAAFTTWFYRVVSNRCIDRQRKHTPLSLEDDSWVEDDSLPADEALALSRQQAALESAIRQLPERQRTALNLCFYDEISNQEAATIMGVSLRSLQSLVMRAKDNLKQQLSLKKNPTKGKEPTHDAA